MIEIDRLWVVASGAGHGVNTTQQNKRAWRVGGLHG